MGTRLLTQHLKNRWYTWHACHLFPRSSRRQNTVHQHYHSLTCQWTAGAAGIGMPKPSLQRVQTRPLNYETIFISSLPREPAQQVITETQHPTARGRPLQAQFLQAVKIQASVALVNASLSPLRHLHCHHLHYHQAPPPQAQPLSYSMPVLNCRPAHFLTQLPASQCFKAHQDILTPICIAILRPSSVHVHMFLQPLPKLSGVRTHSMWLDSFIDPKGPRLCVATSSPTQHGSVHVQNLSRP